MIPLGGIAIHLVTIVKAFSIINTEIKFLKIISDFCTVPVPKWLSGKQILWFLPTVNMLCQLFTPQNNL